MRSPAISSAKVAEYLEYAADAFEHLAGNFANLTNHLERRAEAVTEDASGGQGRASECVRGRSEYISDCTHSGAKAMNDAARH